jgi:hypothetical protein
MRNFDKSEDYARLSSTRHAYQGRHNLDLRGGNMRESSQRFLSAIFEALPTSVSVNIRNRAAIFVSKKPHLLTKQSVRFFLFDVLKVELATVEIRIEE